MTLFAWVTQARRPGRRACAAAMDVLERRRLLAAHVEGIPVSFATIQAAVNAASPGDVINVDAGTYHERVVVNTPAITIRGAR